MNSFFSEHLSVATTVTLNLIHIFTARLDPVWRVLITYLYHEYRFCRVFDARQVFYSRPGLHWAF